MDWYDELLNNTAPVHRYNFNVSGATNSFNYFVDLDWYRENGFFKTNERIVTIPMHRLTDFLYVLI